MRGGQPPRAAPCAPAPPRDACDKRRVHGFDALRAYPSPTFGYFRRFA